ncbi:MAG: putative metal-binding motif-containing protein [Deltaproteobacteria bacterium]|nr:putative metal-binding motif-containing protein [Deltaproteobacteria bacterium]
MSARRAATGLIALLSLAGPAAPALAIPDFCYQYNDQDQDRYVYGVTGVLCPRDDCNDQDPAVHPGATEICGDSVDQDCDGFDLLCPGADDDGDGYRSTAAGGDDCTDSDATVHPGALEVCGDGKDNDCAGGDLACAVDADSDGYGAPASGGTDCDDRDPAVHPHAAELCGDGVDQDCAGGDPACVRDRDGDGHPSTAEGGGDCDDFDRSTHPGAREICGDHRDQDCDGRDLDCAASNPDRDGDGHQSLADSGDDCDDTNVAIHPEAAEVCGDGVDQDCDGADLSCAASSGDVDGDAHLAVEAGGDDCNDLDAAIHPGAEEVCGDGRDQDCDGSDAIPGFSAECSGAATSNPAFDAIREHAQPRVTAPEAVSCAATGAPREAAVWLLLLLLLWGVPRRER